MKNLKKQIISEEEYQIALAKMEFIRQERNTLEQANHTKVYNAHIDLPETFGELLIDLKRKNTEIDEKIKLEKNIFLRNHNFSETALKTFEELVELLEFKNSIEEENQIIKEKLEKLNTQFQSTITTLDNLIQRKIAHIKLYNYINNLEKDEIEAKKIISSYEKQNNKNSIFPFKR